MTRIVHLSDLHFGRVNADLTDPLIALCNDLSPDLIVVSGDFTQRARVEQYEQAAAFMARLDAPTLSVPGNHDTPLDNLLVRFLAPWARYRHHISLDLEPVWQSPGVRVVGVNTVNRFSWQRGRMSGHTVARLHREFAVATGTQTCIAVLHHPLEHLPEVEKRLMRGARAAVAALGASGADIVLSGHLHNASVAPLTAQPGVLFVQAGTGLSTRLRDEVNTFNVLDIGPGAVDVHRYAATGNPAFAVENTARFRKTDAGWQMAD